MNGLPSLGALTRRAVAPVLAALAMTALLLSPGEARAADGDRQIVKLRIQIQTGQDDLRNASHAIAGIKYTNSTGNQLSASYNMNNGTGWPAWSTRTVYFQLPAGVVLSRMDEFSILFRSGQPDPFATGDNWDMSSITVTAILDDESEVVLIQKAGTPLHRFKSDYNTLWATAI